MVAQQHLADRIFDVLDAVRALGPNASLAHLSAETGIPKPTVLRISKDLVARGVLERGAEGYRLGVHLSALGRAATQQHDLAVLARPYVHQLQQLTGQIVWVTSTSGSTVSLVDVVDGTHFSAAAGALPWRRTDPEQVGMLCTAVGRLTLASRPEDAERFLRTPLPRPTPYTTTSRKLFDDILRRARDESVLLEHEQYVRGYSCIAAAIQDPHGQLVGAISITGTLGAFRPEKVVNPVRNAARLIGVGLHRTGPAS